MNHTQANATGPAPPVEVASSFSATQVTWRFLNNKRVTPQELIKPLREFARTQLAETTEADKPGEGFALLVSDWSKLKYGDHTAKKDVVRLTHETNIGYELTTHLLVNAQNGQPIAPLEMHLRTSEKVLRSGTRSRRCRQNYRLDLTYSAMPSPNAAPQFTHVASGAILQAVASDLPIITKKAIRVKSHCHKGLRRKAKRAFNHRIP